MLNIAIMRSAVETRGTIVKKCNQIIASTNEDVAWEGDYKIFKNYLQH